MTHKIDRLMVNIGFAESDVRSAKHRTWLYVAILGMSGLLLTGIGLTMS